MDEEYELFYHGPEDARWFDEKYHTVAGALKAAEIWLSKRMANEEAGVVTVWSGGAYFGVAVSDIHGIKSYSRDD